MTSPPPPPAAGEPGPAPMQPGPDSRNWAVFAHLSAFIQLLGPPAPIGPLVIWLVKRDQDPFVGDQAKEALNFNISIFIYGVVSFILVFVLVGILLLIAVAVVWFIFVIIAAVNASRGQAYRYPLTIRFIS